MGANDIFNSPEMKELINKAKWLMLLSIVNDTELSDRVGVGDEVVRPVYEFLKVFYDHGVEADVVVEALEKLQALSSKKNNEVSSSDLTSFVKVLDDIRKKERET